MKQRLSGANGSRSFNLFTPSMLDSFAVGLVCLRFSADGRRQSVECVEWRFVVTSAGSGFDFLRSGQLQAVVDLLEAGWSFAIFEARFFALCFDAWLSSVFVAYRLAIALGNSRAYCGCLVELDKLFVWSEEQAGRVSLGI